MGVTSGLRSFIAIVAVAAIAGCTGTVSVEGGEQGDIGQGDPSQPGFNPDNDAPQVGDVDPPDTVGCGDGTCSSGEACDTCPQDCGACPPGCGNGVCSPNEDCASCPLDCGACASCGDGACDPNESCASCSQDCGACPGCGNGVCTPNEDCASCPGDCGACPCAHDTCVTGGPLVDSCDPCVAQICAVDSFCCQVAWDMICVSEVGSICGNACPVTCGDGLCDASESCSSCAQDCGACPVCGDGLCDWTEDCASCSQDCGACPVCGNGSCEAGETCGNCTGDCGACVCHDECQTGPALDASCGTCEAQICAVDPFCCQAYWDGLCVSEVGSVCGTPCAPTCGDGWCDANSEDCSTCASDCGACPFCGDGWCDWATETCSSCTQDCGACPTCGDGVCDFGEDCSLCAADCGACAACGDGVCDPGEDCASCGQDCGACPACPGFDLGSFVPTSITGSTAGAQDALASPCAYSDAPERTYSFTAPAGGTYEINTFGSAYDTLIYVHDGVCGGPVLGCNDDAQGLQSQLFVDLVAGQTIIIVVDGFGTQQGAFSLNIL